MARKLASIQRVDKIIPIEGADVIEIAKIKGWQTVVKKGEFSEGSLGVFFEIDSFLPIAPVYEFLRKGCYKKMADGSEGFRLRTVRLRKQLSQGLLLPLNQFPEIESDIEVGTDVTELLKIRLYEPPIPAQLSGIIKGMFPTHFMSKSDQERCLSGGTIIDTEDGKKRISQIVDNNMDISIKSFNILNGKIEYRKIINTSVLRNSNDWFKITLEDGSNIISTSNHKFFLPNLFCFRELSSLREGDTLLIS